MGWLCYYLFTPNGRHLFGKGKSLLNDSEQEILNRYITALNHSDYVIVIESMKHFRFDLSGNQKKMEFMSQIGNGVDDKYIAEMQYRRFVNFSKVTPSEYPLYCSNDMESWAGRFYSPFVSCPRAGRYAIEYIDNPNEPLISLDFSTFQIHCLVKVFTDLNLGSGFQNLINDLMKKDFYEEVGKV